GIPVTITESTGPTHGEEPGASMRDSSVAYPKSKGVPNEHRSEAGHRPEVAGQRGQGEPPGPDDPGRQDRPLAAHEHQRAGTAPGVSAAQRLPGQVSADHR